MSRKLLQVSTGANELLGDVATAFPGKASSGGERPMHVPGLLERVRLSGLDEVYLVTRVDHETQAADLLPLVYGHTAVQSVPFVAMESMSGCGFPSRESDWQHGT